ncbi:MAG: NAD-dependent DNA ligase LigA [Anaerolineae bacterium]|nr:NAD-dependent DNA ligase LigA [Phycisphaerae bacterium]
MSADAKRIEKLREELDRHNYLYFIEAKPQVSDQEFDRLMRELIDLEAKLGEPVPPDSPSQRVGGKPIAGFKTVEHAMRMMSIDNTYNEEELRAFDERVRKALDGQAPRFVMEPKVDGVACNVRYENGQLVLVATRGDGRRGDDITNNARTIRSLPLRLSARHAKSTRIPRVLEVRGEIFMPNSEFQRINAELVTDGAEPLKNPRNATTGTLKSLDPNFTAARRLRFVAHGLGEIDPLPCDSYFDCMSILNKLGIPIGEHLTLADDIGGVIRDIEAFAKTRGTLAYQTDGMVVKLDSFAQRKILGETSKAPRWVIAYKYPAEQMPTVLENVEWQVGKGGTLTPVARLRPVFVAGTTVSNASLHNIEQIEQKDIHIGDTVVIEKAGEIIPQVVQVDLTKRPKGAKKIVPPTKCPSCGAKVEKEADTPYIRCVNPSCPAQLKERMRWFCGRNQMDVGRLGEALIDQLVDAGIFKTFADIYRLTKEQLIGLERMADKSAQNVIDSIQASRDRGLDRLLAGLGIRHVGNRVAYVLAAEFGSLDAIAAATCEELNKVNEIGDVIADSVHDFFHNAAGRETIKQLKLVGIDPKFAKPQAVRGTLPLEGKTVVVTGTMEKLDRKEIEDLIVQMGGKASGSVSKKTSFVVAGESAGSKLEKAKELGVEVISEVEFLIRVGRD